MADTSKGKGLALLLLGGKKPAAKADEPKADEGPSEARKAAAQGVLDALDAKDAEALDEALAAWVDARNASTTPELDD